mmetsp:Transcript_90654/g.194392  ORF Transcript_90654/g.194392 Transcript_90654/m.194392 type:complete len:455 (+) Transcript_90654:96-1460(+)
MPYPSMAHHEEPLWRSRSPGKAWEGSGGGSGGSHARPVEDLAGTWVNMECPREQYVVDGLHVARADNRGTHNFTLRWDPHRQRLQWGTHGRLCLEWLGENAIAWVPDSQHGRVWRWQRIGPPPRRMALAAMGGPAQGPGYGPLRRPRSSQRWEQPAGPYPLPVGVIAAAAPGHAGSSLRPGGSSGGGASLGSSGGNLLPPPLAVPPRWHPEPRGRRDGGARASGNGAGHHHGRRGGGAVAADASRSRRRRHRFGPSPSSPASGDWSSSGSHRGHRHHRREHRRDHHRRSGADRRRSRGRGSTPPQRNNRSRGGGGEHRRRDRWQGGHGSWRSRGGSGSSGGALACGLTTSEVFDLLSREITPDDYELLLRLDQAVPKPIASQEVIEGLPAVCASEFMGDDCAVCLSPFEADDAVAALPCKHCFHRSCITKWLAECRRTCPLCGTEACGSEVTPT